MNQNKKLYPYLIICVLIAVLGMYLFNNFKIEKKNTYITTPTDCFNCAKNDKNSLQKDLSTPVSSGQTSSSGNIEQLTEENSVINFVKQNHELPDFYMTKSEARKAGWDASQGNLCEVLPGKAIGGNHFSNREKTLPAGAQYFEADVNYHCGHRGADRIVFTKNGDVWVTHDHYKNFEKR